MSPWKPSLTPLFPISSPVLRKPPRLTSHVAFITQGVIPVCRKQYRVDNWKKGTVAPAFLEHCSVNGRYLVFEVNCLRPFFLRSKHDQGARQIWFTQCAFISRNRGFGEMTHSGMAILLNCRPPSGAAPHRASFLFKESGFIVVIPPAPVLHHFFFFLLVPYLCPS